MRARLERDSMGDIEVPNHRLYGAQTARAIQNFPISGRPLDHRMVTALGHIKWAAAEVNVELGQLDRSIGEVVARAAAEVAEGKLDDHFPVDVFQTGSGTSSNMNANEVVANRAAQLLGKASASESGIHPNDHVNLGQSSNDVFPTAIHIAAAIAIDRELIPPLNDLHAALVERAAAFDPIVKMGRTHLQDAAPIRLGQEFSGYAAQLDATRTRLQFAREGLSDITLGGTAVGTGLNTHPEFGMRVAVRLSKLLGIGLTETDNHFAAQGGQDAAVAVSGTLRGLAVVLTKIANDIRLLASGPRLGLGELVVPAVQPGSSMMPGKTNPVIAEALLMVCAQVMGNDHTVTIAGMSGTLELNTMLPLISRNLLEQIELLGRATKVFETRLVRGLQANATHIRERNERSLSLATALAPALGHDRAAKLANGCHQSGRTIREVALEEKLIAPEVIEWLLDLHRQTDNGH